jgi:hypothetical protein
MLARMAKVIFGEFQFMLDPSLDFPDYTPDPFWGYEKSETYS